MQIIAFIITLLLYSFMVEATELKDALSYAYQNNAQLLAAREDLKATAEQTAMQIAGFMPTVSFQRSRNKNNSTYNYSYQKNNLISNSINYNHTLFQGGTSLAGLMTAKKQFEVQVQSLKITEQDFMNKAVNAYLTAMQSKEALEINNSNVLLKKQNLVSVQEQYKQGELTLTDLSSAQSDLATAFASLIQADGDYINAKAAYQVYFGTNPEGLNLPSVPKDLPENLDNLLRDVKINNPYIVAAKANIEGAKNNIWATTAKNLSPVVQLQASTTKNRNSNKSPVASVPANLQKQVSLNLSVPLYSGGGEYSAIRSSKIQYQKLKSIANTTMDQVIQNAINAWQGFATAKSSLTSSEEALVFAKKALDGTKQEFEVGMRTLVDVLTSEQNFFNAKLAVSKAKYQKIASAYNIYSTLGKLTAQGLELPVEYFNVDKYYLRAWNLIPNLATN